MESSSSTPSLTASRSPSPPPIVQPDHFYGFENVDSPFSAGKHWLDPNDDATCTRGIPVFKPSMQEFRDFEAYMNKVECWGKLSGIVKVIPPKEWTDSLPSLRDQLSTVKIKTPIEQHMLGRAGLFRQENMEKNKNMSPREWVELTRRDEFRAPSVDEVLHARHINLPRKTRSRQKSAAAVKAETAEPEVKQEPMDEIMVVDHDGPATLDPADSRLRTDSIFTPVPAGKAKSKRRAAPTRAAKEASLADKAAKDEAFLETFDPHVDWLPLNTTAEDYTPEFCRELERRYWRNCGLGKPAWYGADTQGSLYTDQTISWNVAHLESTLSRLLPPSEGLPGVNTPYLYWGMWRATFAWHVEDMDLFSINYIHFGAPKFWYAMPQARAVALEQTMRSYFPKDTSRCSQFLRHKSFLVSPNLLSSSACKPNVCVQHAGEFMITYPRGYHAGFNLGLNCAESVNFALESWIELGRKAEACQCIPDSVRINVDQLLADRAAEQQPAEPIPASAEAKPPSPNPNKRAVIKVKKEPTTVIPIPPKSPNKRKASGGDEPQPKRVKTTSNKPKIVITLPSAEDFPCCLCISTDREGLLRVHDPPYGRKEAVEAVGNPQVWMAHELCARIIPETWVDEIDSLTPGDKEKVVFGVDGIVKDRWNLKCSACTRARPKVHGAPIQCTKGKCSKAFHISCARGENSIVFNVLREVEKEVVLLEPELASNDPNDMAIDNRAPDGSRVLKVIKKDEVQLLCSQHNPAITAAKRASKQDRIRNELLTLPSMARIKIRVSAGVFEVSLIRVIEETSSVEVLWDRGIKREFKWGSVIFGATDGPVQQKPSEMSTGMQGTSTVTATTFSSVPAATGQAATSAQPPHGFTANGASHQWSGYGANHYPYGQYYNALPRTSSDAHNYYPKAQRYHDVDSATAGSSSTSSSTPTPILTTEQLQEMLEKNPALRDALLATVAQHQQATSARAIPSSSQMKD